MELPPFDNFSDKGTNYFLFLQVFIKKRKSLWKKHGNFAGDSCPSVGGIYKK